jgi:hypothetical protein
MDLGFQTAQLPPQRRESVNARLTFLDVVPTALARDLVVLFALDQYASINQKTNAIEGEEILAMVSYIFLVGICLPLAVLDVHPCYRMYRVQ